MTPGVCLVRWIVPEAKGEAWEFDVGCDFGGVSKGKDSIRIGIKLSRDVISLPQADEALWHADHGASAAGRKRRHRSNRFRGWANPEPFIEGTFDEAVRGSPDDIRSGRRSAFTVCRDDNREALLDLAKPIPGECW